MSRPLSDWALVLEAGLEVTLASIAIAARPFRDVVSAAEGAVAASSAAPADRAARIGWAVRAAARRVPWKAKCFQQGLAAHAMLRRRGWATTLYYGALRDPGGALAAHVWVRSGETDVVGCEIADEVALLSTFSA